jgi:hypothetical protein
MIRLPGFAVRALFLGLALVTTCAMAQLPPPTLTYFSFGGGTYGQHGLEPGAGVIAGHAGQLYGTASHAGDHTNLLLRLRYRVRGLRRLLLVRGA